MGKACASCGKKTISGNLISHSNRKTRRVFKPNLQRSTVSVRGVSSKQYLCSRCIKKGAARKSL